MKIVLNEFGPADPTFAASRNDKRKSFCRPRQPNSQVS